MQVEVVEEIAGRIKAERDSTVEDLLARLTKTNVELNDAWDGPAQVQFDTAYGTWIKDLSNYSNKLNAIHTYLKQVADSYRQVDEGAKQAVTMAQ
jgi:WXG100 family type VII secretion target